MKTKIQEIVLGVLAFVLVLAAYAAGVWCEVHGKMTQTTGIILLVVGLLVPVVCALVSIPLRKSYVKKWALDDVRESRDRLWAYREADDTAAKMLKKLRFIRHATDLYALVLALCGLMFCFGLGMFHAEISVSIVCLYGWVVLLVAMSQLRFPRRAREYEPSEECYLSPEEFPELYAMARKAAATQNYKGKIRMFIVDGCNAGIASPRKTVMIQLGDILLNILSQEELYQVFLHEFGHCAGQNQTRKERLYMGWLANGRTPVPVDWAVRYLLSYPLGVYVSEYQLYDYAATVQEEQEADDAVRRFGNPEAAASELIKNGCYNLFEWSDNIDDFENVYQSEQPVQLGSRPLNAFRAAMEKHGAQWVELLQKEILSRSSTHPTTRMRMEALGVTEWKMLPLNDSDAWQKERAAATQRVNTLAQRAYEENYEEERKENYLAPLKTVEEWEAKGCPVIAEEYADVVSALRDLGRVSDAMVLCDRAIAELPEAAGELARYMKGCYLLNCFDPAGLELVYHAMEHNNNFVEEGLNIVGTFCCLTGRAEELELYREKAVELQQRAVDTYNQTDELNPNDNLSEEHLPDGMLEGILTYLQSMDEGAVRQVYLVRKTVTEDFSASAVVLRFDADVPDERKGDVFHKMFRYLDTSTDWYFTLFDYEDVRKVDFDAIPGSCVYTKAEVKTKK